MANLTVRQASEISVPKARVPRKTLDRRASFDAFIRDLPKGDIGELVPDENETLREISISLHRAGQRLGMKVETWNDGAHVFFRHLVERTTPKRTRQPKVTATA